MTEDFAEKCERAGSHYRNKDYAAAFPIYLDLANRGCEEVQCVLGWMYANGKGTEQNDQKAKRWLLKAASHGEPEAQMELGVQYAREAQYAEAVAWIKRASEQEYAPAIYRLATCYYRGRGVPKDRRKWLELVEESALRGNLRAQALFALRVMMGARGIRSMPSGMKLWFRTFFEVKRYISKHPNGQRLKY